MSETLLSKPIRGFLSYFSNSMTGFPSTYRSELIDEDSNIQINAGGEETDPNVPMAAVLYQTQALLTAPTHPLSALQQFPSSTPCLLTAFHDQERANNTVVMHLHKDDHS